MTNQDYLMGGFFVMAVAFVFLWLIRGKEISHTLSEQNSALRNEVKQLATKNEGLEKTLAALQSAMIANTDEQAKRFEGLNKDHAKTMAMFTQINHTGAEFAKLCKTLAERVKKVDDEVHHLHMQSHNRLKKVEDELATARLHLEETQKHCLHLEKEHQEIKKHRHNIAEDINVNLTLPQNVSMQPIPVSIVESTVKAKVKEAKKNAKGLFR